MILLKTQDYSRNFPRKTETAGPDTSSIPVSLSRFNESQYLA